MKLVVMAILSSAIRQRYSHLRHSKIDSTDQALDIDDYEEALSNTDTIYERVNSEDREDDEGPSGFGNVEVDSDNEEDPPEWEMGIRRSNRATSNRMEDLTLSDIILDPDGNITYYWLAIVTLAVVYNIGSIILRIAFNEMRDQAIDEAIFNVMDTLGDLVYVLDIFVHLRISFYEDGCLVLDPTKIMNEYKSSTKFKVALFTILPYGTFYKILTGIASTFPFGPNLYISGDVHIILVRLPRLLKYPTMARFFDITDSRTRNPNLIRAFKLTLNLWMVIHWIGCVYYVLSEYEGLGSNNWVYPNGSDYSTFSRKYIRVMYWSLMTLTTIGERPPPETDLEFVFTGLTFLIGVFVFAAVVGNVGDVISNMNAGRAEFQSRMDQIKSYLQHRHVDEKLQNRVKRWAEYTWKRTQSIDEPSLLQLLPDRLRTEIAINVHLETLKKVKIFEECEEGLLRELVLKLRPQVYSPGDFICRTGEIGKEMFIVNHGKVEIMVPSQLTGRRTVVATLTPGNYFGEISLLKLDDGQNRRTADVKAVGYSELLRLSRKDLMSALVEYPNAKRILEQQAKERIMKTKEMRRTSTIDDSAIHSLDASPEDQGPGKKDLFLRVIKSDNFRKLLAARRTEMNEMREVLDQLKRFDSQATNELIKTLQQQKADLQETLQQRNKEVIFLKQKLDSLYEGRKLKKNAVVSPKQFRKEIQLSPKCVRHSLSKTSMIHPNRSTIKQLNGGIPCNDRSNCLEHTVEPKVRRVKVSARSFVRHFSMCPVSKMEDQCKCKTLRHSSSTPDVLKGSQHLLTLDKNHTVDSTDLDISKSVLSEQTALKGSDKSSSDANGFKIPKIIKSPSSVSTEDPHQLSSQNDGHELDMIETFLEIGSNCLTDSSAHSSDDSSDENSDIDFDLDNITDS